MEGQNDCAGARARRVCVSVCVNWGKTKRDEESEIKKNGVRERKRERERERERERDRRKERKREGKPTRKKVSNRYTKGEREIERKREREHAVTRCIASLKFSY